MIDQKIERLIRLSDRCFAAKDKTSPIRQARGDKLWAEAMRLVMKRDKCRHQKAFNYIVGYKYE
jgi:hypothetical protein